jgi:hypothetical protein
MPETKVSIVVPNFLVVPITIAVKFVVPTPFRTSIVIAIFQPRFVSAVVTVTVSEFPHPRTTSVVSLRRYLFLL